jgi:uncharacterized protein
MLKKATDDFQLFVKPIGAACNLSCDYCYYLGNIGRDQTTVASVMPGDLLENYIAQHISIAPEKQIFFSWHGGEPTLAGLAFFRKIAEIQHQLRPADKTIVNGIQTNGTLLNEEWCRFLATERFMVGISLDGPEDLHCLFRNDRNGRSTFNETLSGLQLLKNHRIPVEILCVVNATNVKEALRVYRFFKALQVDYLTFLPLVEKTNHAESPVSSRSVPARAFGEFLIRIFDEWKSMDIGKIKIQIFEEALRTAFGLEHTLCIFKRTCGRVPVLERNGDVYSCDHFVAPSHLLGNIRKVPLLELLGSPAQQAFGQNKLISLPDQCLACEVREMCNGACPKDRLIETPDGQHGLNYLCEGYRLFFNHCQPFVEQVAEVWKSQKE